ncbi:MULTISPECIES: hypothetical protein [Streptomyces]|uniref:hypothetical protein n=1 Tax=Streptomyces TaxID=1883 RepID=UPI00345C5EA7
MSGRHAREGDHIDVTHPAKAVLVLLVGALIPPAAVMLSGHDTHAVPRPVTIPETAPHD